MAQSEKVGVVTGANKGIGFQIARELSVEAKFDGIVYLTARNEERGHQAVEQLISEGADASKLLFHQLDLEDQDSIDALAAHISNEYGGLDLLISNAGFAYNGSATEPPGVQAEDTIRINYYGTKAVCLALFPLLRTNAHVVNLSSSAGRLQRIRSEELRERFLDEELTYEKIDALMEEFKECAKNNTHESEGWGGSTYAVSKVGVSSMTRMQAKMFVTDERNIIINHNHPGYVNTDMTNGKGHLTLKEGARSSIFCALLPNDTEIRGAYVWSDCSIKDWENEN